MESVSVQLTRRICRRTDYAICHVLLGTFSLSRKQRCDGLSGQSPANLTRTCLRELVDDRRMFLAETTRIKSDEAIVPLEPLIPRGGLLAE